jgi:pilus assembly protein CpaF
MPAIVTPYSTCFLQSSSLEFAMRPFGISDIGTPSARAPSAPADGALSGGFSAIFGDAGDDERTQHLAASWGALQSELRTAVEAVLRGGLSAGDIAYRLGELVHGFYRTRGVTLASYELRRLVIALLDCHRRGWPPPTAAVATGAATGTRPPASTPESDALVAFVNRDARRPPHGGWNSHPASPPPATVALDLPSSLVSRSDSTSGVRPGVVSPDDGADVPTPDGRTPSPAQGKRAPDTDGGVFEPPAAALSSGAAGRLVSVEVALARILPTLRRQSSGAPGLAAPRHAHVRWLRGAIASAMSAVSLRVAVDDEARLERAAFDAVCELGPLESVIGDATVAGVFVDAPDAVFVERAGRLEPAPVAFGGAAQLTDMAEKMLDRFGGAARDRRESLIDRHLDDGTRVTIVVPPLAPHGPHMAIRRAVNAPVTLESLAAEGLLSPPMVDLLRQAVRDRLNVMVCGVAGSGATPLLSALVRCAPTADRAVSVVPAGAALPDLPGRLALIASGGGIAPARALAAALALRPDRLVVDDIDDDAMPGLVDAVAGGCDGILVGVTAPSLEAALTRWEAALRNARATQTAAATRRRLARALPLLVQLARQGGVNRITRLAEMPDDGDATMCRDLFSFEERAGRFVASGLCVSIARHGRHTAWPGVPDAAR